MKLGESEAFSPDLVVCLSLSWGMALLVAASAFGQMQPVYPTYEGWTANDDGTYTLVFGYHNANSIPVEIAPGPENGFLVRNSASPAEDSSGRGVEDLGQPTRFLPGRQRSVCRMVVGPEFRGNLQWRLGFAGISTETTERGGVDPLYLLEAIGPAYRATRDIDTAAVEKRRCINRPPIVSAGRDSRTAVGELVELSGFVADDGLPRGAKVESRWRVLEGPGDTAFIDASMPRARLRFLAAGDYRLELLATDSMSESRAEVTVHVTSEGDLSKGSGSGRASRPRG